MILHYSIFEANDLGNGAYRRTYQIKSLLAKTGEDVVFISKLPSYTNTVNYFKRAKIAYDFYKFYNANVFNFRGYDFKTIKNHVYHVIVWKQYLEELLKTHKKLTVVYEASLYSDYALVYVCHLLKIKIIGIPHNIESLVIGQQSPITKEKAPNWFAQELTLLKTCDEVFTISREEQWLLSLHGISAKHLPYIPSQQVLETCATIKEQRLSSDKKYYLSLGTASNPPTLEGFKILISFFEDEAIIEELLIGGYQTEIIKQTIDSLTNNVKLLGSLDTADLKQLMIHCKAMIVHQVPTTGALTKIPEMLLSGIPIICNTAAARNYFNTEGVYVYDTKEDLIGLLNNNVVASTFSYNFLDKSDNFLEVIKN